MNTPANPADPPLAEPGKRPTGADVGGVAAAPQAGVADGAQRSTERGEEPAHGRARTGATDASTQRDDDEDEWRHEPVAPVDERNPLRSLGKAVGETVTGSDADTSARKR